MCQLRSTTDYEPSYYFFLLLDPDLFLFITLVLTRLLASLEQELRRNRFYATRTTRDQIGTICLAMISIS